MYDDGGGGDGKFVRWHICISHTYEHIDCSSLLMRWWRLPMYAWTTTARCALPTNVVCL